ncbi:unnamed protein product [Allacma fusca]|uniref:Gcp-like domain-containing protein n=1 Tax=Allacma fusca TaxID=39272 RepID=A0A8J2LL52_9HEXA|nr:unnamed protein product [Allacma fusca]
MHKYRLATTKLLNTFHSSLPVIFEETGVSRINAKNSNSPILSRRRHYSSFSELEGKRPGIILGIETSCDDTGAAVVTTDRRVLGESLHSQLQIHLNHGGIIPPIARHLHEQNIGRIIREATDKANVSLEDIDAIATTVKPGLALSLLVGVKWGKDMCLKGEKPFIPIHHMEAHALTARMLENINFPYLVLLISGGHCLLAVAKGINDFLLLGRSIDDAPGEAFDKTARRLKLHNMDAGSSLSGGAAIEHYAKQGNPEAFQFPTPMYKYRDCNWSFAGLKFIALRHILREERKHEVEGSDLVPSLPDICASFQHAVVMHLCKKIQRGMIYAEMKNLIPENNRILVVSGGVACNDYVKRGISIVCEEYGYKLVCPPKNLCTDNGVMIAWNGVEKWRENIDVVPHTELDTVDIEAKSPFGTDLQDEIRNLNIKCKRIKMSQLFDSSSNPSQSDIIA